MGGAGDPIRAGSAVSTGMVEIRPQHVRSTGAPALWVAADHPQVDQPTSDQRVRWYDIADVHTGVLSHLQQDQVRCPCWSASPARRRC